MFSYNCSWIARALSFYYKNSTFNFGKYHYVAKLCIHLFGRYTGLMLGIHMYVRTELLFSRMSLGKFRVALY